MITRRVALKLVAFVVIGVVATVHLLSTYVGVAPFRDDVRVTIALTDASGLFEGSEVTYRGVRVGRVEEMTVTDAGTDVEVLLDGDAPDLPADLVVTVANRSAIGEQYLDLRGAEGAGGAGSAAGEVLAAGDRIDATDATVPPSFDDVLRSGRDFVASVPEDSLRTVIDESYLASRGVSDDVAQLVDSSLSWARTADANFLVTTRLIENSATVLDTQLASAQSIQGFSRDLGLLAETLRTSDGDLRDLVTAVPPAATQVQQLVAEVGPSLGVLLGNLVTPASVFGVNAAGVEDLMIRLPDAVSAGWVVAGSGELRLSLLTTFADPLPCTTGYEGTTPRPGLDTTGGAFNTGAGCTTGDAGSNVRGPGSVPTDLDDIADPSSAATLDRAPGRNVVVRDATTLQDLLGGTE